MIRMATTSRVMQARRRNRLKRILAPYRSSEVFDLKATSNKLDEAARKDSRKIGRNPDLSRFLVRWPLTLVISPRAGRGKSNLGAAPKGVAKILTATGQNRYCLLGT